MHMTVTVCTQQQFLAVLIYFWPFLRPTLFSASPCHRDAEADEQFGAVVVVGAGGSSAVCPAEARRHSESLRQADTRGRFQLLTKI